MSLSSRVRITFATVLLGLTSCIALVSQVSGRTNYTPDEMPERLTRAQFYETGEMLEVEGSECGD